MPLACPTADATGWPDAFDKWRLDDAAMAEAFDSLTAHQRAAIKTGIAMHFALHGEHSAHVACSIHDRAKGFAYTLGQAPMAWTVLFIPPAFAAGPRLVAALMPALLAGVPLVAVVCVGGQASAAVCASLELMGVEQVFCLPHVSAAQDFLHGARDAAGSKGCALFLHQGELHTVYQTAQAAQLQCWQEVSPPCLALHTTMAQSEALITWCHPDASRTCAGSTQVTALFRSPKGQGQHTEEHSSLSAPLILGVGMEGFWWYAELEPRNFLQKSLSTWCIPDNFSKD